MSTRHYNRLNNLTDSGHLPIVNSKSSNDIFPKSSVSWDSRVFFSPGGYLSNSGDISVLDHLEDAPGV